MTKKELEGLKPGTVLYNGHTEGVIKMDGKIKCIEVLIPIYGMSNDSNHVDERPDGTYWTFKKATRRPAG